MHQGGAARAASRMHEALRQQQPHRFESAAFSARSELEFPAHSAGLPKELFRGRRRVASGLAENLLKRGRQSGNVYSFPLVQTRIAEKIPEKLEVLLIHWIGTKTVSYQELLSLNTKRLWYAHDLWIAQLTEHLPLNSNAPAADANQIFDRWLRRVKRKVLEAIDGIVVPSEHMADRLLSSEWTQNHRVAVAAPPLDCLRWQPLEQDMARQALGLEQETFVVGFAAHGGLQAPGKGGAVFREACRLAENSGLRLQALVAGEKQRASAWKTPYVSLGKAEETGLMQLFYAAADVIACPSTFESFGQVASESHAMARPVIAFRGSGMDSIVVDEETGLLIGHSAEDLASALIRMANDAQFRRDAGAAARLRAEKLWAYAPASERLAEVLVSMT